MSFADYAAADARLIILRSLAAETNGTLNSTLLTKHLELFGHLRSREWVHTQLNKLVELGAIQIVAAGSVIVATITRTGLDHVERRSLIEGVARPSPGS